MDGLGLFYSVLFFLHPGLSRRNPEIENRITRIFSLSLLKIGSDQFQHSFAFSCALFMFKNAYT